MIRLGIGFLLLVAVAVSQQVTAGKELSGRERNSLDVSKGAEVGSNGSASIDLKALQKELNEIKGQKTPQVEVGDLSSARNSLSTLDDELRKIKATSVQPQIPIVKVEDLPKPPLTNPAYSNQASRLYISALPIGNSNELPHNNRSEKADFHNLNQDREGADLN